MNQVESAKAFITAFTRGVPDDCYTYIWRKAPDSAGKKNAATKWFNGGTPADEIAKYALDSMHSFDVYIGMGLSDGDHGRFVRLARDKRPAAGIMGLWADIDFGNEGHKNGKLPANEDEALDMLSGVLEDIPPTMAVNSGGGVHLYWLFNRPMIAGQNGVDLPYIREFVRRWINMLSSYARKAGFDLDPVHDVERVLRVAGTLNHKYDPPREAKFIVFDAETRYESADLWEACESYTLGPVTSDDKVTQRAPLSPASVDGDLIVDARRQPPLAKLEAIKTNTRDFNGLWNKRSKRINELPDSSASVWEFNLMLLMLRHNWTDQEIVDAVTYWRGKHHQEPQEKDVHYFQQSIGKARAMRENGAGNNPPPPNNPPGDGQDEGDPIDERGAAAQQLSRDLGLARRGVWIKRIVRYDGKEPHYRLETQDGKWFELGSAANLAKYDTCKTKIFSLGFTVIAARDEWLDVMDRMHACTDAEEVLEAKPAEQIMGLLEEYLEQHPPQNSAEDTATSRKPFWQDSERHFYLRDFTSWLVYNGGGDKWSTEATIYALKSAGVQPRVIGLRNPNDLTKTTTRSVWRIPRVPLRLVPTPDDAGTQEESETNEA